MIWYVLKYLIKAKFYIQINFEIIFFWKIWLSSTPRAPWGPLTFVTIMCHNDELSLMMSWVGCLPKDSELFILFAGNSQIFLKISVIPILLTFIYLVALNMLVNNHLNSSLRHIIVTINRPLEQVHRSAEKTNLTWRGNFKSWFLERFYLYVFLFQNFYYFPIFII